MNFSVPAFLKSQTQRTTFLSEGVKLCGIICAISVAPLPFVNGIVSYWLLSIFTIVGIGTFGVWFFNAITNRPLLNSEEHTEQMATIALLGQNRDGKSPLIQVVDQQRLGVNPAAAESQEADHG